MKEQLKSVFKYFLFLLSRLNMLKILTQVFLIVVIIYFGLNTIWALFPGRVLVIKNPMSIKTDKSVYKAGEEVTYSFDYCKYRNISSKLSRTLADGSDVTLEETSPVLEMGCHTAHESFILPLNTSPDMWHVRALRTYELNPKTQEVDFFSILPFQVINPNLNK